MSSVFGITALLTCSPGDRLTAPPEQDSSEQAQTAALPSCTAAGLGHTRTEGIPALPMSDTEGNKEQHWGCNSLAAPLFLPSSQESGERTSWAVLPRSHQYRETCQGSFPLPWQEGSSLKSLSCLWQVEELVPHRPDHRGWGKYTYYQNADGMFPAGSGSSLDWQTETTQQGVPGGQESIPSFLPSLVSLFATCTGLTGISCSDCPCLFDASQHPWLAFLHCPSTFWPPLYPRVSQ